MCSAIARRGDPHVIVVTGAMQHSLQDHWQSLLIQMDNSPVTTEFIDYDREEIVLPPDRRVVVLFPTPYLEHYPAGLQSRLPSVEVAYAGYGLPEICTWPEGEFGLDFFKKVDYLMCSSPAEVDLFVEHGVHPDRVRFTGNPLLFRLLHGPIPERFAPRTLLWAPHWTKTWVDGSAGFSNWNLTVHDLLAAVPSTAEFEVIIRPHGLLAVTAGSELPVYASDLWTGPEFDESRAALTELLGHPNVTLSSASLCDDLERSSHVLTDGISMMGYAPASGRPSAVVRRADSPVLARAGAQLLDAVSVLSPGDSTRQWLDSVFASPASKDHDVTAAAATSMRAVVQSVFPTPGQPPGRALVDWVLGRSPA